MVVQTPDIGRSVTIPIIDANVLDAWPERCDGCCTHTDGQERREQPKWPCLHRTTGTSTTEEQ